MHGVRLYHGTQTTYDLTIDSLHTYFVEAGGTAVLVHNANPICSSLTDAAAYYPDIAHTLSEHVAEARVLAARKTAKLGRATPNSVFVDEATAQQVVDYAIANNSDAIETWLRGSKPDKELTGFFGSNQNPLGWSVYETGDVFTTGNQYTVILKRATKNNSPGQPFKGGYFVFDAYPS